MANPWDRAASGYLEEWVPRFIPYHNDLVRTLALGPGARVLVAMAGPGAEVLAVARVAGPTGVVRATDASAQMVALCEAEVAKAGVFGVTCGVADVADASGGMAAKGSAAPAPWDAVLCAFGFWQVDPKARISAMRAWREALAPRGKVGLLVWGPSEPDDPFEKLGEALRTVLPASGLTRGWAEADRASMANLFEEAGLVLVRHTVLRHTMSFPSAERFVRAMREACTWRRHWEELGDVQMEKAARAFYEWAGGPDVPLSFAPPATLAVGGLPGAELELEGRPSLRVPASVRGT
jgi:SAM-dependent methyltransferase